MNCERDLIILPYETNMSWFIALLAVTFYSQRLRIIMLEVSKRWNTSFPLFKLYLFLLHMKYKRSFKVADYDYFKTMTLENLLEEMNNYNKDIFCFDTDIINSMHAKYYIKNLYNFFDISSLMISVYTNEVVTLDPYNNIKKLQPNDHIDTMHIKTDILYPDEVKIELQKTPDILIIRLSDMTSDNCSEFRNHQFKIHYYLTNIQNIAEIMLHNEDLIYNNVSYKLDAVLLDNLHQNLHTIAGMTCNNTRYVYNGWRLKKEGSSDDLIPCDLMEFNWDTNFDEKFYLQTKQCGIVAATEKGNPYCYSFEKGERILLYVRTAIQKSKIINSTFFPNSSQYSLQKQFAPTGLLRIDNSIDDDELEEPKTQRRKRPRYKKKLGKQLSPIPE